MYQELMYKMQKHAGKLNKLPQNSRTWIQSEMLVHPQEGFSPGPGKDVPVQIVLARFLNHTGMSDACTCICTPKK